MKDRIKTTRSAKTGALVLTARRGEKFSAVAGLKLSGRMATVVQAASHGSRVLSSDERRALVKDILRKK